MLHVIATACGSMALLHVSFFSLSLLIFNWRINALQFLPYDNCESAVSIHTSPSSFLSLEPPSHPNSFLNGVRLMLFNNILVFFFGPHHRACRTLVPRLRIESRPLAVETWGPNHCTNRESPGVMFFILKCFEYVKH